MCSNAAATAGNLMKAIRPTLVSLLTLEGVNATTQQNVLAAFDAAQVAITNWKSGSTSEVVVEALDAFTQVFDTLPIPQSDITLANLIEAGVVTVIGVITANSPAPTETASTATAEETQGMHAAAVVHETTEHVNKLVPGFKRAIFTAPDHQYKNAWNKQVESLGGKYAALKQ